MEIEVVKSPGGLEAWLVRETSVPLVAMTFLFEGGNAQDPEGKEGLANFLSTMLDEGAGDLDAAAFQRRVEELAVRFSFDDGRDSFRIGMQTLRSNLEPAVDLLKLALTKPTFGDAAVARMKSYHLSRIAASTKNPNSIAGRRWAEAAFPDHPYGRPSGGTRDSVSSITGADLEAYRKRVFAQDNLKIAVVGDIDAETLKGVLDRLFGDLEPKADLVPIPAVEPAKGGQPIVVARPLPQSVAIFGKKGIARDDDDFIPAFVMNHILGGGGFSSRLMTEVREKRGLAYSVYSYLQAYEQAEIFAGGVATQNERVAESLEVINAEIARMASEGPTEEELSNAIEYLVGSYPLRFDTNGKVAQQLLGIQEDELGIDYPDKRNGLIRAVTIEDVKRVAKRILDNDNLITVVVGSPIGLPK